ncbi:lipocalin family protein, partial [Klebsiella pneumoniae]|uniref:lipocalin family protein n=1 Tax=Klebsiella pneumoniae TaxID=573 RepID=UPI00396959CC
MKLWPVVTGVAIALTLVACKSPTPPKGVQPISGFDASRYLGKWYEVARLENRFERGLEHFDFGGGGLGYFDVKVIEV